MAASSSQEGYRRDRRNKGTLRVTDRIPSIHLFDKRLREVGASTFALELQSEALQASKRSHRPTYEQRVVELVHDRAAYRRELQFFRLTYTACDDLTLQVHSVSQQLLLNYYLRPGKKGDRDEEWLRLAEELAECLRRYGEIVGRAEYDWVRLAEQQSLRDRSTAI
jgi:hypothetical protein